MSVPIKDENGSVIITENAIKTVVGKSVIDSYGVKKMSSQAKIYDNVEAFLKHQDYGKGITVKKNSKGLSINIHLIAPFTNLIAVSKSIQSKVKFNLQAILGIKNPQINVIIENVSISNNK